MAIIFLVIIWTPAVVVIWTRFLQSIRFWQANEYTLQRFYNQIRYNFGLETRKPFSIIIKIVLLITLSSFVFDPTNQYLIIPALLTYALFSYEASFAITKAFRHLPSFNLANITSLIASSLILFGIIYAVSTLVIDSPVISILGATGLGTTLFIAETKLILFLVFASIVAIGLDLGSLVIVSLAGLITWPLRMIEKFIVLDSARKVLSLSNFKVILVTGNWHDQATAISIGNYLNQTSKAIALPGDFLSDFSVAKAIINSVNNEGGYLVINVDPATETEAKQIVKLLNPYVLVFTGHTGNSTISEVLVNNLPTNTILISSGDSLEGISLARSHKGSDILFFTKTPLSEHLSVEPTLIETLISSEARTNNDLLEFNLRTKSKSIHIQTKSTSTGMLETYLILAGIGTCLGQDLDDIAQILNNLPAVDNTPEVLDGINETKVVANWNLNHLRTDNYHVELFHRMHARNKFVVHTGYKNKPMEEYANSFGSKLFGIDYLVTLNQDIANAAKNKAKHVVYFRSSSELIYFLQSKLDKGDAVLLLGRESTDIMNAVINDER